MKPLPRGITDFGSREQSESVSELEFKRFCYGLLVEFKYYEFELLKLFSGNYYAGLLKNKTHQIYVLMNRHYPLVGLADRYEYGNANYIDHKEMNIYINSRTRLINQESKYEHYICMSIFDLEQELTIETIKLLDKEEIDQLNYWKPTRIKDIIFNNWD